MDQIASRVQNLTSPGFSMPNKPSPGFSADCMRTEQAIIAISGPSSMKRKLPPRNNDKVQKGNQGDQKAMKVVKVKTSKQEVIKVRTTPNPLFNAVRGMSEAQQHCITEMGFRGLIGMKMDGIPT